MTTAARACWCGNADLLPFNENYARCPACETLVLRLRQERRLDRVENDDEDFYGRNYWFGHQEAHLGHANLFVRARQDLADRCIYWLRTLLKYAPPAGPSLELGCAHGAFVALMQWAGFDAAGLELSPWIADFARQAFGVTVYSGPVEEQNIAPGSLRVVVAMDVLEHLEDPVGTVGHCVTRLAEDGVCLFQTPSYPEGATYEALVARKAPFLDMLQPQEHIYLFSRTALQQLLRRSGLAHIVFEPAIFAHYDMCVLASRQPLQAREPADVDRVLMAASPGRLVRSLFDLDDRRQALTQDLAERDAHVSWLKGMIHDLEADRAARLAVIERQGAELGRIPALEADVAFLKGQIEAAEVDRAARLAVIERQGAELGRIPGLEADVAFLKAQAQPRGRGRAPATVVVPEPEKLGNISASEIPSNIQSSTSSAADVLAATRQVTELQQRLDEAERDREALRRALGTLEARTLEFEDAARVRQQLVESQMKREDLARRVDVVRHSFLYRLLQTIGIFPAIDPSEPGTTKD